MERKTIGSLVDGERFLFGGVEFVKQKNTSDEMVVCQIGNTDCTVYIYECAVVQTMQNEE